MEQGDPDIVVVGGGPAGLKAARSAAAAGVSTLLLERGNEIGSPVRTSGGTWIEDMKRHGVPEHLYRPTTRVRIASPGREIQFDYDPPINCVLDVRGLYQQLAVEAFQAGADVRVKSRVYPEPDGAVRIDHPGGSRTLQPAVVIDASGSAAAIARSRGLAQPTRRLGTGAELELHAPDWDEDEIWLGVGSHLAPSGYGWIFPCPGGRVRAGVGLLTPDAGVDPTPYLRRLVEREERLRVSAEIELHRGVIPSEGPLTTTVGEGLLVVGDAAGQVLATAGEGIRFAMELGELAGQVAADAVLAGALDRLGRYESGWSDRYRGLFTLMDRVNRKLARLEDHDWDRALGWMEKIGPGLSAKLMRGDVFRGRGRMRLIEGLLPVLAKFLRD